LSAPVRFVASPPGVAVAVHDLGGGGDPLVTAHAAGFHGLVFSPLARGLAAGFRCVTFDGRGHGDTALPRGVDPDWYGLAADLLAVVEGLGLDRPLAFGHSSDGFVREQAARRASRLPDGHSHVVPGVGHFGPLERPDADAAAAFRFFVEAAGAKAGR
jgi:pimeloyl-ACP methyl ester carboxylesterase